MALCITSLNSGSNGNCYYIGNATEAVLVDAGLSCREIEKRMQRLNLQVQRIKAVFISHEHTDHIKGVEVLARKHQLPVYITSATLRSGGLKISEDLVKDLRAHEKINIGALTVTAFPKFHDASDPHSFIVSDGDVTIGVFTDIGSVCSNVITHFKQCHAVFLEANYDEVMLEEGPYPFYLKRRISGTHGHLSNREALELFLNHRSPFLTHILLAHLSKENNSPQLAQQLFERHAVNTKVVVASRYYETEVFEISELGVSEVSSLPLVKEVVMTSARLSSQMSLF